jgi:uncharacterized protein (DUF1015 family)
MGRLGNPLLTVPIGTAFVRPFRALRYGPSAGDLGDLVALPVAASTPDVCIARRRASPFNVMHLLDAEPGTAASRLREWVEQEVLVREEVPAVWRLEEEFEDRAGERRLRRGVVARVAVDAYSRGRLFPHEKVFPSVTAEKIRVRRAIEADLCPIFLVHDGPPLVPERRPPDLEAAVGGVTARLWRITDAAEQAALCDSVGRGEFVIADGHHRFAAALAAHRRDRRPQTSFVLAVLVSRHDAGIEILPTHRLVRGEISEWPPAATVTSVPGDAEEALARLEDTSDDCAAFAVVEPRGTAIAEVPVAADDPAASVPAAVAEQLPVEPVAYTPDPAEAERLVGAGAADAAILVPPPTLEQVEAAARARAPMPEKTTYFYPKPLCGLVFAPCDE